MQWYYAIDGERFGPVPHSELERLVQDGTIVADTLIWRQGMNEWQSLAQVRSVNPAWIAERRSPTPPALETAATELAAPKPAVIHDEKLDKLTPAGFWPRVGAYLLDLFFWGIMFVVLLNLITALLYPELIKINEAIIAAGGAFAYKPKPEEIQLLIGFTRLTLFTAVLSSLAYDVFSLLRFGATPGKLIFGLRVVQADDRPLGFWRIVARSLAKGIVGFTLGIGYLIAAFDEQKRGLHDFICKTRVVKKR